MMLICRYPTSDEAVSDVVLGREDFVSSFACKVVPDHPLFEPEVEFPHGASNVVSNFWGSVQTRGDSVARRLGISRNTVARYAASDEVPRYKQRDPRPTKLSPFHDYILERVAAAQPDTIAAPPLLRELRDLGYKIGRAHV